MTPADTPDPDGQPVAANDNGDTTPDPEALRKVDAVALRIARLLGRQMAREDFARITAANDNTPRRSDDGAAGKE